MNLKIVWISLLILSVLATALFCYRKQIRAYSIIALKSIEATYRKSVLIAVMLLGLVIVFLVGYWCNSHSPSQTVKIVREKEEVYLGKTPAHSWVISTVVTDANGYQHLDIEKISEYTFDNALGKMLASHAAKYQQFKLQMWNSTQIE